MDVVVDTSAAVAIVTGEGLGEWVALTLGDTEERYMSVATTVELSVVLTTKLGPTGPSVADHLLKSIPIAVVPLDQNQARLASTGFVRYGKGRHRASLNFGDCFVYGLAASLNLPVVCLGNDFPQTDLETIRPASPRRAPDHDSGLVYPKR